MARVRAGGWAPATGTILGAAILGLGFPIARAAGPATVTYRILSNGQEAPEEGRIVLECGDGVARVHNWPASRLVPTAPEEVGWIDFAGTRSVQTARFNDGSRCSFVTAFTELPTLEVTTEHDTIQGFACLKATTVIRSNRIQLWFTRDAGLRGSPSLNLVVPDGLVLKVVRNGNYEIVAEGIEGRVGATTEGAGPATGDGRGELERGEAAAAAGDTAAIRSPRNSAATLSLPTDWGEITEAAGYRARLAESWVTTVRVFDREPIRFSGDAKGTVGPDDRGVYRCGGGTLVVRRVTLPAIEETTVFAEVVEASRGDAYDRTGSVIVIPTDRPGSFLDALHDSVASLPVLTGRDGRVYHGITAGPDYLPPVEVMRFITPFGVRHYNEQVKVRGLAWADSVVYKMEVTDLLPVLRGEAWIGVFVGNYDAGGHEVSLTLRFHANRREESSQTPVQPWLLPLCNTVNVLEMAGQEYGRIFERDTLSVEFELPARVENLRLRYLTTGHGGWENGDEFTPRVNTILIDGRVVANPVPWRSDCASFRRNNPASGNFWNGLSSSDFSRSGWCPGATVNPLIVPLSGLAPGRHRFSVAIPAGAPEGGSFSAWNVSAALTGEMKPGD
jgi:hypothetical protein